MATWTQVKKWLVTEKLTDNEDFVFRAHDGVVTIPEWNVPGVARPTLSIINAVEDADAWYEDYRANKVADPDNFEAKLRAIIKGLVIVINSRLPSDKQISDSVVRSAIIDQYKSL